MAALIQYEKGVQTVKYQLDQAVITLGRAAHNDICIDDVYASKSHAIIEVGHPRSLLDPVVECVLKDLDSTNGTYVNERRVGRIRLRDEDILRIGRHTFKFVAQTDQCGLPVAGRHNKDNDEMPTLSEAMRSGERQVPRFSRRLQSL